MDDVKALLTEWRESGTSLSFNEWKARQIINNDEKEITLSPIIKTESEPKLLKKHTKKSKTIHISLDSRVLERLKNIPISTKINEILRAYYDIPPRWNHYDSLISYPEKLEDLEIERLAKIKARAEEIKELNLLSKDEELQTDA